MSTMTIRVGIEDFDAGAEIRKLQNGDVKVGAVCSLIGFVRDFGDTADILGMELEHYPGMTEKALREIAGEAGQRWPLEGIVIIHRVGNLKPADQIVLVACSSAHRKAAFSGCEYIIDYLKVRAPFWKKEITAKGARWVDAKTSDEQMAKTWHS
jgi:molybdopterin synthase catalytic subunit